MKILLFTLAVFVIVAQARWIITETNLETCTDGSWRVSAATFLSEGNGTDVALELAQNGLNSTGGKVHEVRIHLPQCVDSKTPCEKSTVSVKDVDCRSPEISPEAKDACDIALMMGKWEERTGIFRNRNGKNDLITICITHTRGLAHADELE